MSRDVAAAESLLAFWADCGVDTLYQDQPSNRMRAQPSPGTNPPLPPRAKPGAADEALPAAIAQTVDMDKARALAEAAESLESLADAIAAFDGCALKHAGARRAVFARGNPSAPVMIIGEAPGGDEDMQGAPFVGRAGQLLDRMLAAASLEQRVYITNTVFWRPPGNRTPTMAEQMACRPFLERAIALSRPKFLLLVGGAAAKGMLNQTEGILSLRGRWFEWRSASGHQEVPALPTLHPAFLLRQPTAKKMVWRDLLTLIERLDRPGRPE